MEKDDVIQAVKEEQEKFIYHINEIENLSYYPYPLYYNDESLEQEYLMYIEEHCKELRELIDKLYRTKLYIIKNDPVNNGIEFYRHLKFKND